MERLLLLHQALRLRGFAEEPCVQPVGRAATPLTHRAPDRLDPQPARQPLPPALREVVFASDLSNECDISLSHARLLAERFSAHLRLYHVLQAPSACTAAGASADELWDRREAAAKRHLCACAEGVSVTWDVVVERAPAAAPALLAYLGHTRPGVAVMTTRRRTSLAHLVLGSVTETVLEHGDCPLLCVREPEHGVALPYRRVLVPTDLSEASRRALPLAALLARAFGAQILALHVIPRARSAALVRVARRPEAPAPDEHTLQRFLAPQLDGLRVVPLIESGEPGEGILRAARLHRPDAIVMSTRRRDSLKDRILGTNAERVLRDSPCPVLVV